MSRRRALIAGVVAILLSGPGCVCCGANGYGLAREAGPNCDVPTGQRDQVYVFAVGGLNPLRLTEIDKLREELNRHGFAKVATAQTLYSPWVASEMRRIRADKPEAVFVLVGVEGGTSTAVRLAEKAVEDGVPVGAVVLVDPTAKATPPRNGVRTVTITSADAAAIAGVLNDVAVTTPMPVQEEVTRWHYPHAPLPRPVLSPERTPQWAYLFDQPGGMTRPIGESSAPVLVTTPATAPPPSSTTRR